MDIERAKKLAGVTGQDVAVSGVPHDNLLDKLTSFIQQKQGKITIEDLRVFASKMKSTEEAVHAAAFELLGSLLKGVGKHKDKPDADFDAAQLEQGVKVEQEHTNNAFVAKLIAKDHLVELPDYYTRLSKMEKGAD